MSLLEALPEVELTEDGKHYVWDGQEFERVTHIIHESMPPYLAPWAEKVGQQAVLTVYDQFGGWLPSGDPGKLQEMIRDAGLTCEDEKKAGQDRGAALHQAIEAMVRTGEPTLALEDFDHPEHLLYAQSFGQWMIDYQPEFLDAEVRIVHPEHGYAGTFDGIVIPRARPKGARGPDVTGQRVLIDYKTNVGKKVYASHLYQLAAYQLALEYWKQPVDAAAVVAIGPMGKVKGKPYSFKVSYIEPPAFGKLMEFYHVLKAQKKLNPLGRSK